MNTGLYAPPEYRPVRTPLEECRLVYADVLRRVFRLAS